MAKRPKKRVKHPVGRLFGIFAILILSGIVISIIALLPYAGARMDPALMELPEVAGPAVLLSRTPEGRKERAGELHIAPGGGIATGEQRVYVPLAEMPEDLLHAFVAIEDKRFYRHQGVDFLRTAKAGLGYVTGRSRFGGSTITQQLIKNLTGEDERRADRKLREIFEALELERHASKQEILEVYLNIINLSGGCRGVGAAAEQIYGKKPSELTLSECASLAAITQNPTRYDPRRHPDENKTRRDTVLRVMAEQGYITNQERDSAMAEAVIPAPQAEKPQVISSWYADLVTADVIRDLCERLGYTRTRAAMLVYSGGLTVEVAMDEDLQALVESYYENEENFAEGELGRPQSAFILMDPDTGDILAVAGAIGKKTANRVQSYATDTRRPAGSCIKPLSLYAPALERGLLTWGSIYEDAPLEEANGVPWPANGDGIYRGRVTIGRAVAESINTVAVRVLDKLGMETSFQFLRESLGMKSLIPSNGGTHDMTVASLALGQQCYGVTLRELTAGYTACATGCYRAPVSYHRVLDSHGNVLLSNPRVQAEEGRVLSEETAAIMTKMLEGVTEWGTAASYIHLQNTQGIAVAGKTGTTQNNCDRLFVGYTPRLLAGVWTGYDYPAPLDGIKGNPSAAVWDALMGLCESAYRGAEAKADFDLSPDVIPFDICPLTGHALGPYCTDPFHGCKAERGWFSVLHAPWGICSEHEEPPVRLVPDDPAEPDRIPLLPGEGVTEEATDRLNQNNTGYSNEPWISRWFRRFAHRGSSPGVRSP